MLSSTVIYDANVLVPAVLRDLLLRIARADLVRAHFSAEILDEMARALRRLDPKHPAEKLERLRQLMTRSTPDCVVADYDNFRHIIALPDPDDVHVVAAALRCRAQAIITYNVRDFPRAQLEPFSIDVLDPDDFIADLVDLAPVRIWQILEEQAAPLRKPPRTPDDLLDALRCHIPTSVGLIERNRAR